MMTLRNYQPVSLKAIKKLLDGKLETKVQLDLGDFKESVRAEFEGMGPRVTGTENQVAPTMKRVEVLEREIGKLITPRPAMKV